MSVKLTRYFDISKPGTPDIFSTLRIFQVTQHLGNAESLRRRLVPVDLFLGGDSSSRTEFPFAWPNKNAISYMKSTAGVGIVM